MDLFFLTSQFPRRQLGITPKADPTLLQQAANAIRVMLILPSSCVFRSVCWSWSCFSFGGLTGFVCFVWPSLDTDWTRDCAAAQNTQTSLVRGPARGARKCSARPHSHQTCLTVPFERILWMHSGQRCGDSGFFLFNFSSQREGDIQEDPPCCVFLQEVQIEMKGSQILDSQPQGSV